MAIVSILFRAHIRQTVNKKNKTESAVQAFVSEFKFRANHGFEQPGPEKKKLMASYSVHCRNSFEMIFW